MAVGCFYLIISPSEFIRLIPSYCHAVVEACKERKKERKKEGRRKNSLRRHIFVVLNNICTINTDSVPNPDGPPPPHHHHLLIIIILLFLLLFLHQ